MTLDKQHKPAFEGYEEPLKSLEEAFNRAGVKIRFYAFVAPLENKMVRIFINRAEKKTVCIEGDSPAQAVKDVAGAVKL
jgi:hypothetical protein